MRSSVLPLFSHSCSQSLTKRQLRNNVTQLSNTLNLEGRKQKKMHPLLQNGAAANANVFIAMAQLYQYVRIGKTGKNMHRRKSVLIKKISKNKHFYKKKSPSVHFMR